MSAGTTDGVAGVIPALGPPRAAVVPDSAERTLDNGLRVLVVRRPGVPLVELRLRIPLASRDAAARGRASLLAHTMLLGTSRRDELDLVRALQELGSELSVNTDADRLLISGGALAPDLDALLALLAEVLLDAAYPNAPVEGERQRLARSLTIARSQPEVIAGLARARQIFGRHPYGVGMPAAGDVSAVSPRVLRALHRRRVQPVGATLVLVGDLETGPAIEAVAIALGGWPAGEGPEPLADVRPAGGQGRILLLDRPGAVQSQLRLSAPGLPREDPGYAALQLANMIFGGYFSSRFVTNLREDKGYTYTPRSGLDLRQATSLLTVDADVSTAVTAPALVETRYELGRIATLPVTAEELADTRQYVLGSLALQTSTQAGLAATLAGLAGSGLGLDWLVAHRQALLGVTVEDVHAAAAGHLAPQAFATLVVGDAARVRSALGTLGPVLDGTPA